MGLLTLQNIATSGLGFIFLFVTIRLVSNFQYGIYSAVLVTMTIASTFAGLGVNYAATRFVSLHGGGDDEKASWAAARNSFLLSLLLTGIATVVYASLSPLFSLYFAKNTSWTWAFLLGAGWVFTVSLSNTLQGILQGLKKYVQLAKILFVTRFAMVVFTVALLYFYRSIEIPLLAWILYYSLVSLWIFFSIANNLRSAPDKYQYSTILRYALPLGVAAIIAAFSTSSDSVVVGGLLNPSSLGVYQAAISISGVLGVVAVTPLTTALFPEISSSKTSGEVSNGVRLAFRFATFIVLPISLFVAAVSSQLLALFTSGGVYLAGTLTLELIALFYVFVAIQTMLQILLQAVGKTVEVIVIGVVTAATDIGLSLLLVPHFGLAGAVTSRAAVALDGALVAMYLSRKYMGNLDRKGFYLKGILSSAAPFAILFVLSAVFSSRLITLVPYAVAFALLYLLCVRQLHLLTQEDRAYLVHTLPGRFRRFVDYL